MTSCSDRAPVSSPWPVPFSLVRHTDVMGISGKGLVASGVLWPDGQSTMRWISPRPPAGFDRPVHQVATYASPEEIVAVHGHQGGTELCWHSHEDNLDRQQLRLFGVLMRERFLVAWGVHWLDGPAMVYRCTPASDSRPPSSYLTFWRGGREEAMEGEYRVWGTHHLQYRPLPEWTSELYRYVGQGIAPAG